MNDEEVGFEGGHVSKKGKKTGLKNPFKFRSFQRLKPSSLKFKKEETDKEYSSGDELSGSEFSDGNSSKGYRFLFRRNSKSISTTNDSGFDQKSQFSEESQLGEQNSREFVPFVIENPPITPVVERVSIPLINIENTDRSDDFRSNRRCVRRGYSVHDDRSLSPKIFTGSKSPPELLQNWEEKKNNRSKSREDQGNDSEGDIFQDTQTRDISEEIIRKKIPVAVSPMESEGKESDDLNIMESLDQDYSRSSEAVSRSKTRPIPMVMASLRNKIPEPVPIKERLFKVLLIGDPGVGKTSFVQRYTTNVFKSEYKATVGVDFALKVLRLNEDTVAKLQLWDVAGQERFTWMTRVYYRDARGCIIMFDLGNRNSFINAGRWKRDLDKKCMLPDGSFVPCLLLANKCDLRERKVTIQEIEEFYQSYEFIGWTETSAKNDLMVKDSVKFLVDVMIKQNDDDVYKFRRGMSEGTTGEVPPLRLNKMPDNPSTSRCNAC